MRPKSLDFLKRIVNAPSPSGYEQPAAKLFWAYTEAIADRVTTDVHGNVAAALCPDAPMREIIHHRQRAGGQPVPPKIIDVTEEVSGVQFNRRSTSLKTIDMKAYHQIIETELRKHFVTDPTLMKISVGEPVSDRDLESLVSLILTQSPNASREVLAEFFSATAEPLQYAIRTIIGMDPKAVEEREHLEILDASMESVNVTCFNYN
jgi:hypothetical protein